MSLCFWNDDKKKKKLKQFKKMSLELLFEYTELMDQRIEERDFKSKGHDYKGSVSFSFSSRFRDG